MNYPEKGTVGIYKITSPSGRIYIGQSSCIAKRWYHYKMLDCKKQPKLHHSFKKYSVEEHEFEVLEMCLFEDLNVRERYWQEFYNVTDTKIGLNCVLTDTSTQPKKLSQEVKDKIGKSNGGDNHWTKHKPYTEEHRKNLSIAGKGKRRGKDNPMFGKVGDQNPNYGKQVVILNLETGIYYNGYEDAAYTIGMPPIPFSRRMLGYVKNTTSFILCYNKDKVYL